MNMGSVLNGHITGIVSYFIIFSCTPDKDI